MRTQLKLPPRLQRPLHRLYTPFTLVGAIALGYVVLGVLYVQADGKTAELERRAQVNRAALRRPMLDLENLEADLRETEGSIEELKSRRVSSIPEEDLVQQTLSAARQAGITVSSAGTRVETTVDRDGGKVRAPPFFLRATGAIEQIEQFLAAMEKGSVETLEIQSALVTRETNVHVLTLSAVIYSHPPLDAGPAEAKGQATPTSQVGRK
ncbi:MAG: hypothetical protein HY678_12515 [Chloroflexi bacterium]|nr:hypothetical protein [Chloroflexota bacterium]